MMAKNKKTTKAASKPDLTVDQAISKLKDEILQECRLLADNKIMTVYQLIEKTKELQVLEKAEGIIVKSENNPVHATH